MHPVYANVRFLIAVCLQLWSVNKCLSHPRKLTPPLWSSVLLGFNDSLKATLFCQSTSGPFALTLEWQYTFSSIFKIIILMV